MIAIYLAPIYIAILVWIGYLFHKAIDHLNIENKKIAKLIKCLAILQFILTAFIGIGFLLENRFLSIVGSYWLGISLYLFLAVLLAFIFRKIFIIIYKGSINLKLLRICELIFVIVFTTSFSIYGVINARTIRQTNYEVTINKKVEKLDNLKIALIADTHFGYNIDEYHLKQVVDIINENDVDLVVVAGDIFDNNFNAIKNPDKLIELFNSIKSKYGIYGVLGNHDVDEKILAGFTFKSNEFKNASEEMLDFINDSNINLLYDESILIDDSFYLYGRPDYSKPNFNHESHDRISALEITNGLDKTKPIICIDHEPTEFKELAQAGVDLDLSGHTHDGQIWPSKYLCQLIYENAYGMYSFDNFTSITTSGVGLFGPNMRTFTKAEVALITINFE